MKTASLILLVPLLVQAYPRFPAEIPNADKVKGCDGTLWPGVGHDRSSGGGSRNAFGVAFKAAGFTWTKALCQADSDGDGVTNGQELGDPSCVWTKGATPQFDTGITHPGLDCSKSTCKNGEQKATANSTHLGCQTYQAPSNAHWDFALTSHTVKPGTSYMRQAFTWNVTSATAIVRFQSLIRDPRVVHHMLLFSCHADMSGMFGTPTEGGTMPCYNLLVAWAVGGPDFCLPDGAGFIVYPETPYYLLEIHYDNPSNIEGITDTSGIRVHHVPFAGSNLIPAGISLIAASMPLISVPPGQSAHRLTVTVSQQRIDQLAADVNLTIFAYAHHMHQIGRKQWLTAVDASSGQQEEIACITNYDFNLQEMVVRPEPFVLTAGKKLVFDCVYDSTSRAEVTNGGDGSDEEMCLVVLMYTPARRNDLIIVDQVTEGGSGDHVCGCPDEKEPGPIVEEEPEPMNDVDRVGVKLWLMVLSGIVLMIST